MSKAVESTKTLRDELERCRTALAVERSNARSKVWRAAIQWGALLAIAGFVYRAVRSLAGKLTLADIDVHGSAGFGGAALHLMTSCATTEILGLAFGASGIVYGLLQQKLRGDVIKKYYPYMEQEQKAVDKDRTSSLLMPGGGTRPEDI
ncbi:hypothetical protein [Acidiferrobacter sp.]